ncbi:MAG TPA: ammonium transporter [Anaerolineales bacterium]|nr:ammonium transporter [Anaerolineales bacterium]
MNNIDTGATALVLVSAALVMLMTPGLAFFYGGLVRRKNVLTIMMQSFISMGIVTIIWVFGGFSLAFGKDIAGIIGDPAQYFALRGVAGDTMQIPGSTSTIPLLAFFVFQEMFAIITPALITGAFADRVSFKSYLIFLVLWSFLVYIPFAHWVWGGGFLQQMGFADFAGGMVVHASAGFAALASVLIVGKRKIKKGEKVLPHNITYVALGAALLWFGWFGFNGGSALGSNGLAAVAFVNTDVAASFAMITWMIIDWIRLGKPSMVGALTGSVAGLATVTPAAGFVQPEWAAVIGIVCAIVCYGAIMWRAKMRLDDALDVWGVHGVGGAIGILFVGIFAGAAVNKVSGLIEGNVHQFLVQLLGMVIAIAYSFVVTFILLWLVNLVAPVRVPEHVESKGLDKGIFGEDAYVE